MKRFLILLVLLLVPIAAWAISQWANGFDQMPTALAARNYMGVTNSPGFIQAGSNVVFTQNGPYLVINAAGGGGGGTNSGSNFYTFFATLPLLVNTSSPPAVTFTFDSNYTNGLAGWYSVTNLAQGVISNALQAQITSGPYVLKAGDTMTGSLEIGPFGSPSTGGAPKLLYLNEWETPGNGLAYAAIMINQGTDYIGIGMDQAAAARRVLRIGTVVNPSVFPTIPADFTLYVVGNLTVQSNAYFTNVVFARSNLNVAGIGSFTNGISLMGVGQAPITSIAAGTNIALNTNSGVLTIYATNLPSGSGISGITATQAFVLKKGDTITGSLTNGTIAGGVTLAPVQMFFQEYRTNAAYPFIVFNEAGAGYIGIGTDQASSSQNQGLRIGCLTTGPGTPFPNAPIDFTLLIAGNLRVSSNSYFTNLVFIYTNLTVFSNLNVAGIVSATNGLSLMGVGQAPIKSIAAGTNIAFNTNGGVLTIYATNLPVGGGGVDLTAWHTNGDTVVAGSSIGTLNAQPLIFTVNSAEAGRLTTIGGASFGYQLTNTGSYADNFGYRTTASGPISFAAGDRTKSTGQASFALGQFTVASGDYAFGSGSGGVIASGINSFASGNSCTASGDDSVAIGDTSSALGYGSFASGAGAIANNDGSFVWSDSNFSGNTDTAPNQFVVGSAGGVFLNVGSGATGLNMNGMPGLTTNISVLTALPNIFKTLYFTNGILVKVQ